MQISVKTSVFDRFHNSCKQAVIISSKQDKHIYSTIRYVTDIFYVISLVILQEVLLFPAMKPEAPEPEENEGEAKPK